MAHESIQITIIKEYNDTICGLSEDTEMWGWALLFDEDYHKTFCAVLYIMTHNNNIFDITL